MQFLLSLERYVQLHKIPHNRLMVSFKSSTTAYSEIEIITRIINDHSFPDQPLLPTLKKHIPPTLLSTTFVENVLGRLFATHCNGLKALEFFQFSLSHSHFIPSSDAFEKALHILARMRHFDKAWDLMGKIGKLHPYLLTRKSMSIMLRKIAKFQSYEDTLQAFERMEKKIFVGNNFGTEEFNVLLGAFCTERKMKEARSVFQKMIDRFPPTTKTMNILLSGFKESGDVTALELFYHDMVRRGFKPNIVTYSIRIDAYCKKSRLDDALRLFEEMENANCMPTLQTITTLIHGAGVARNILKARQLFDEIPKRNMKPDIGAYNALMSSLVKCREVDSAIQLMDEMEEKNIGHDRVTYHTLFLGLIKSSRIEGVCELYHRMIKNFIPMTATVIMLMKYFCTNNRIDMSLDLWRNLLQKGCCPHGDALDLLVTRLCSQGRLQEAFDCSKQSLERGTRISEYVYRVLERHLLESDNTEMLRELNQKIKKLQLFLPPSKRHAVGHSSSASTE